MNKITPMFNEVHKSSCSRPDSSVSALCLEQGQRHKPRARCTSSPDGFHKPLIFEANFQHENNVNIAHRVVVPHPARCFLVV